MITKVVDFPSVTLVGVINGDTSLNIPDFRSGEKYFFTIMSSILGELEEMNYKGEVN
jgi:primosomal protein N' (replication factor Y)